MRSSVSGRSPVGHLHRLRGCGTAPRIDTVAAVESVVEAAAVLRVRAGHVDDRPSGTLAEIALALAGPDRRQPGAARSMLDDVLRDPSAAACAYGCTLGAVLVWRAVDRAERAGRPCLAAAEAGLRAAFAYLDLVPARQFSAAGVGTVERRAVIAELERQFRVVLSEVAGSVPGPA